MQPGFRITLPHLTANCCLFAWYSQVSLNLVSNNNKMWDSLWPDTLSQLWEGGIQTTHKTTKPVCYADSTVRLTVAFTQTMVQSSWSAPALKRSLGEGNLKGIRFRSLFPRTPRTAVASWSSQPVWVESNRSPLCWLKEKDGTEKCKRQAHRYWGP